MGSGGHKINGVFLALVLTLGIVVTLLPGVSSAGGPYFQDLYPAQHAATVDPNVPASNYWALLIGINDYAGSTTDNIGSYQDARDIRKYLLSIGWLSDHIALVANRHATASMIIQGIRWLASKTNGSSTVVFSFSGHGKPASGNHDNDGEARDVALWAADNRFVLDGNLGREMDRVAARQMWINIAACRAGGYQDAGMIKTGRVLTFSSPESELSYEDPAVHYTVAGWYLIVEGFVQGRGDLNGDGHISVEEAAHYARPNVIERTNGKQHPVYVDKTPRGLYLTPPPPPPPPPPPQKRECTVYVCKA